ncbi:heparinase II/III domain-containing protein [Ruegeria arenilitoris]|uniref:heparinase II/III domain-containing protein n=1 Tax=Ruegeria arenilitoris TaxID=1173585 RepID=UPI00147BC944|nr:heparinase II/III family protein [Ruegeria arenilitoris]
MGFVIAAARKNSRKRACFLYVLLLACLCATSAESQTSVPKVILTEEVVQRIEAQRAEDSVFALKYRALIARANAHLQSPTIVELLQREDGEIHQAFQGFGERPVERLTTLALAWRLTGDSRYAERTRTELLQLSDLETWHPENFLGLSRVSLAVSLGYSWISETLDPQDHKVIRTALVENALKEADKIYDLDALYFENGWVAPQRWVYPAPVPKTLPDGTASADITWPVASFNWNIVCNTGMIVAALVSSEAEPELTNRIIERAQASIHNGFAMFAPDGAWSEGPMYGALSARDAAVSIDSLNSILGHDFRLSKTVGLERFGEFLIHVTGPTGMLFNYGDSDTSTDPVALTWLASYYNQPNYNLPSINTAPSSHPAFELIWQQSSDHEPTPPRKDAYWSGGLGLVTMRSAWEDPDATFVGFKAGPLSSHHNNLDAGTFVLEANNVRWAVDLGIGNYQLPGYFTDKRFDYYRTATIGQNTLTFNEANQIATGRAQINEFGQYPGFNFTIADLSDVYGKTKGTIMRGIAVVDDKTVVIQDEINSRQKGPMAWTMHTEADVLIAGSNATLTQEGQELRARILSPPEAEFVLRSANPCKTPYASQCRLQNPNTGVKRLMVDLNLDASTLPQTITIVFESEGQSTYKTAVPLSQWSLTVSLPSNSERQ